MLSDLLIPLFECVHRGRVHSVSILTVYRLSIVQNQHTVEQESVDEMEMVVQRPGMLLMDERDHATMVLEATDSTSVGSECSQCTLDRVK